MDFGASPPGGNKIDKEQVMETLKTQYALANVQELLQVINTLKSIIDPMSLSITLA